ncbi:MFS transporter [Actinomycetospora soli]|uniref:MFS transporter n=1 Tax=Actinomycetospora soli TaxID=2893887 RepID=UPI001E3B97D6|nr:MFS transporter [Actinomycetospora soli]MCD2191076.1 MFS transporter [Actinomycetospora soli]
MTPGGPSRRAALHFVVVIGLVSLFGDMTHEAAKGVNGAFLAQLGASGAVVASVAGIGELAGYLVRLWSGPAAGRSGRYWTWTVIGYLVNLLAVPALALAGSWPVAAGLIVLERVGKGLRNPPRDTMISFAGNVLGQGWAFALREALDQAGAVIGPLAVGLYLLARPGELTDAYAWLLVPTVLALAVLLVARHVFPAPGQASGPAGPTTSGDPGDPRARRLYLVAVCLTGLGYVDFTLVAFHLARRGEPLGTIPLLYALAMGVSGLCGLAVGRAFDRVGLRALVVALVPAIGATPLLFLAGLPEAVGGVVLWGIGLGVQDSVMSAPIAAMVRPADRSRITGYYSATYGTAWFAGSVALGVLYDRSVPLMVAVSAAVQLAGAVVLARAARSRRASGHDSP